MSENNNESRQMVRVLHSWEPQHEDELGLRVGDILTVLSKESGDAGWWRGQTSDGRSGVFPDNFVQVIPVRTSYGLVVWLTASRKNTEAFSIIQ